MKTAMQELIERLDKTEKQLDKENNLVMSSALFAAKSMALEAIKKEKEQIIEAQVVARITSDLVKNNATKKVYKKWAEEYYNQTYNNGEN